MGLPASYREERPMNICEECKHSRGTMSWPKYRCFLHDAEVHKDATCNDFEKGE